MTAADRAGILSRLECARHQRNTSVRTDGASCRLTGAEAAKSNLVGREADEVGERAAQVGRTKIGSRPRIRRGRMPIPDRPHSGPNSYITVG